MTVQRIHIFTRRLVRILFALAVTVSTAAPGSADVWVNVGSRYQAMGGAGVAVADGSLAQYWNPAAFGFMRGWDAQLPISANYSIENRALEDMSAFFSLLNDADAALGAIAPGNPLDSGQVKELLVLIEDLEGIEFSGQSLQGDLDVGLLGHVGRLGFGVLSLTSVNIRPIIDTTQDIGLGVGAGAIASVIDGTGPFMTPNNTTLSGFIATDVDSGWEEGEGGGMPGTAPTRADQLVYLAEQAGLDTGNEEVANLLVRVAENTADGISGINQSEGLGADIQGLSIQEFGIAYGRTLPMPFFEPLDHKIAIGGVLKYMVGVSYSKFSSYTAGDNAGDVVSDFLNFDNVKISHNVGLDLGLLAQPYDWLRVGLTARNVNSPTFDRNRDSREQGDFEIDPQVRLGVAVMPFENWIIASDIDLTSNTPLNVENFESRIFALGTEYTIPFSFMALVLRLGGNVNTANLQNNDFALTGGLALRFGNFLLELSAGGSFKDEEFLTGSNSTTTLPTRLGIGLGLRWESRPEGTRRHTGRFTTPE